MKKLYFKLLAMMAVVMSMSFIACSDDNDDNPSKQEEETTTTIDILGLWKCTDGGNVDKDAYSDFAGRSPISTGDPIKFFSGDFSHGGISGKKVLIGLNGAFFEDPSITDPTEEQWNEEVDVISGDEWEFDEVYTLDGNNLTIIEDDLDRYVGTVSVEGSVMTFTYKYQIWSYDTGLMLGEIGPYTAKFQRQ